MRKKFGVLTFGRGAPTERELKSSTYQVPVRLSETNAEQYRERVDASVRVPGRQIARDDRRPRGTNAQGCGEDGFREGSRIAQHGRGFAQDDKTDAPVHARQFAQHDRSDGGRAGARRRAAPFRCASSHGVFRHFEISTTHVVASMVCFRDGVPDKNNYRRYRIRTVEGQDDFASMAEVVRRRYSRILLEARAANSDAAEFSQENAFESVLVIGQALRLPNLGWQAGRLPYK